MKLPADALDVSALPNHLEEHAADAMILVPFPADDSASTGVKALVELCLVPADNGLFRQGTGAFNAVLLATATPGPVLTVADATARMATLPPQSVICMAAEEDGLFSIALSSEPASVAEFDDNLFEHLYENRNAVLFGCTED